MSGFWPKQRQQIKRRLLRAQQCRCAYCGCHLTYETVTIDHVVPRCLGGTNSNHNLRGACRPCNLKKAAKPPHLWLNELAQGLVA